MSLIFCPECHAKISSSASVCPHCGFTAQGEETGIVLISSLPPAKVTPRVTVRMGHGSHDTDNLVAPLMLRCSDGQPAPPWEDRGEERRKADERGRRDRERDRKRRRGKVARNKDN